MSNIQFVQTVDPALRPKTRIEASEEQKAYNLSIYEQVSRWIRKYFRPEEYGELFTHRRSDFSDKALINDFFKTEQPLHPIPRDEYFTRALKWTRQAFKPSRILNPVAFPDLRYYPMTLNTNVEAPWNTQGWRFHPKSRNVDLESEIPKVSTGLEDRYKRLFATYKEWRIKGLMDWLSEGKTSETFDDSIDVETWLKWKQQLGINNDAGRVKHNLYPEIFVYNRFLIHQIKDGEWPFWSNGEPQAYYWNTVHARSHVVGPHELDKIRAVFGATWLLLMGELMFIWPLQAHYQNHPESGKLLWGREIMRGGWRLLRMEGTRYGIPSTVLSADWSQFDRRLLHELMREVFDIWRSYFNFDQYEETSFYNGIRAKADRTRLQRLWDWVCDAILHTPTLLPNGDAFKWTRNGFGSGYQMTQLMDTFANSIMIITCLVAMGVKVEDRTFWIRLQGDDSIASFFEHMFVIYGPNFLHMLREAADYYFNAKLSPTKSRITRTFEGQLVLGYTMFRGMAWRTTEDLLSHLLFPESDHDDWNRKASVVIGLAYATCGTNERCYEFLRWIYSKIIRKKGAVPDIKHLRWIQRAGIFLMNQIDVTEFPDRRRMIDWQLCPHVRTEIERQRVWPTKEGPKGRFYFLHF